MKKKKVIIIICSVLAVAIVAVSTVTAINIYNNNVRKQQIEQLISDINESYNTFVKESDRNNRVELIKKIENDFTEYLKDKESSEKVKDTFQNKLSQMKSFFTTYYDNVISENTLTAIDNITDKSKLNSCKNLLTTLLDKIKEEKDSVITNETFEEYKTKIQGLIDSYTQRIEEIEKAEQEAKEKLEQEAKALLENSDENDSSEEIDETDDYSYEDSYEDEDYSDDYSYSDSEYDSSDDSDTPNNLVPITEFPYEELYKEYIETYGSNGWFWN